MADFAKIPWQDNDSSTPLTAERGPNRWEDALEELGAGLDFLSDQVAALSPAGTGGGAFLFDTTAQRPNPEVGVPYYDVTLGQLIIGNGTSWDDAMGDPVDASSTPAPGNLEFTVEGDGDIVLTWSAVAGADTYKLYEDGSLAGVAGKTAMTGTTTTVTKPSTARTYNFWLTATDGGIESAISNIVSVVVAPEDPGEEEPDPEDPQTPAQILNIGTGGSQNYFNEGIGYSSGHVDKTMAQIIAGFDQVPYFTTVSSGGIQYVQFQVFMNGARTSTNTKYPRSELRELLQNGTTKAAWDATDGIHEMSGKTTLKHIQPNKPWVTIAQIHDSSSDSLSIKLMDGDIRAVFDDSVHATVLLADWDVDEEVSWKINVTNGTTKIYINNVLKITSSALSDLDGNQCYFKAGCYPQSATGAGGFESSSEYCRIWLRDLDVNHTD